MIKNLELKDSSILLSSYYVGRLAFISQAGLYIPAEILTIAVFLRLFHHTLIGDDAQMLGQ